MNLVIDVGNTFIKIGVFEERKLIWFVKNRNADLKDFNQVLEEFKPIEHGIVSIVGQIDPSIIHYLTSKINLIEFSHQTPIPVTNQYNTPTTLGYDRMAAVTGASEMFPGSSLLVIDAGTCITYDYITSGKAYLGGGISPGISLRFKSLHGYTAKLPIVNPQDINYLIGKSTEESILSGVMNGAIQEINGIIDLYSKQYESHKVVMTGGDLIYFEKTFKNIIFAVPNLVLIGLNEILEYNT